MSAEKNTKDQPPSKRSDARQGQKKLFVVNVENNTKLKKKKYFAGLKEQLTENFEHSNTKQLGRIITNLRNVNQMDNKNVPVLLNM